MPHRPTEGEPEPHEGPGKKGHLPPDFPPHMLIPKMMELCEKVGQLEGKVEVLTQMLANKQ